MSHSSFSLFLKNRKKTHTHSLVPDFHPSLSDSTLAASDQTTTSQKRSLIGWHSRENQTLHLAWFETQTMSSTTSVTQTGGGKGQLLTGNLRQWRVYRYQKSGRALIAPSWQLSSKITVGIWGDRQSLSRTPSETSWQEHQDWKSANAAYLRYSPEPPTGGREFLLQWTWIIWLRNELQSQREVLTPNEDLCCFRPVGGNWTLRVITEKCTVALTDQSHECPSSLLIKQQNKTIQKERTLLKYSPGVGKNVSGNSGGMV